MSVGASLKALVVDSDLLGGRVFRQRAPKGVTWPYATFLDPIDITPELLGDGQALGYRRVLRLDLFQSLDDGGVDDDLPGELVQVIDGAQLTGGNGRIWRARVRNAVEIPDPTPRVVHHSLTVAVAHDRASL